MRIIALLALLSSLACSDAVLEPRPGTFGDRLQIKVTPVEAGDTTQFVYQGVQDNLLYLRGRIATPDPCYDLAAYRAITGNELKVTIVATRRAQGCDSMIDRFNWESLTDMPSCPHLTVWYHFEGGAWPDRKIADQTWFCAVTS